MGSRWGLPFYLLPLLARNTGGAMLLMLCVMLLVCLAAGFLYGSRLRLWPVCVPCRVCSVCVHRFYLLHRPKITQAQNERGSPDPVCDPGCRRKKRQNTEQAEKPPHRAGRGLFVPALWISRRLGPIRFLRFLRWMRVLRRVCFLRIVQILGRNRSLFRIRILRGAPVPCFIIYRKRIVRRHHAQIKIVYPSRIPRLAHRFFRAVRFMNNFISHPAIMLQLL